MTSLRVIMDAARAPEHFPARCQGFMVYAGGAAEHVWTDAEIHAAALHYEEAVPVWVYAQGRDGKADGIAFDAWLKAHFVGQTALVLLDMETDVDLPYVQAFEQQLTNPLDLYGSTSTLFNNPEVDGWWPADPTGSPHLYAHPNVDGTQYAWYGLQQTTGPWDLSLVRPGIHLWNVRQPYRRETTTGAESLLAIAAASNTHPAAVLRLTARKSPPDGFEPAFATYLDHGDLTAPVPAGISLWIPE